jgi:hypothetical protein
MAPMVSTVEEAEWFAARARAAGRPAHRWASFEHARVRHVPAGKTMNLGGAHLHPRATQMLFW